MKALYEVVRDLEYAFKKGQLTPTFIETYADKYGERVSALYALCAKNFLEVEHEKGRNDHLLVSTRERSTDQNAVAKAMEDNAREMHKELRAALDDGRPYALRKPSRNAFFARKRDH
ncbi:MAG: hypothetical protein ACRYF3_11100 [Janthinobacterium lividum]